MKKKLMALAITTCMLLMTLSTVSIAGDDDPIIIEYEDHIIVPDEVIAHTDTYDWGFEEVPMGNKAGESWSRSGISGTWAYILVHTLNDSPDHPIFKFIFNEMYAEEFREFHKAYISVPTIDIFIDFEWIEGWQIAGVYVPEDTQFDRNYFGAYGVGKYSEQDKIIPFRVVMKVYVQNETNPNRFDLDNEHHSSGIWYYDVPPIPIPKLENINSLIKEELVIECESEGGPIL